MKKIKRLIAFIVVVALAVGGFWVSQILAIEPVAFTPHVILNYGNLVQGVNVRGNVESVNRHNVHSALSFLVDEVFVEIGDFVSYGDVLAILDTADLDLQIAQQRAELSLSDENALQSIDSNLRIYQEARANLDAGLNTQVSNAESQINTAQINLEQAIENLENAEADYENPNTAQIAQAQAAYTAAALELENNQRTHENNRVLLAAGAIPRVNYENSETALIGAQNRYSEAAISLENAETTIRRNLENAQNQYASARLSLENAQIALTTAVNSAEQELNRLASNLENSQIAANNQARIIAIERLERQLEDSVITAPASGTITAVFADEGSMASGLMFVIEDIENLQISTRIREYDAARVAVGMPVEIRSDSTGQAVFEGILSHIDPTALRNQAGDIASITDVEFGAEITVLSQDTGLRIGMNTRLNIILDEVVGVLSVPFDSIWQSAAGDTYVYIAERAEEGYFARMVPVVTGLETDFFVQISGADISVGTIVLSNALAITDGMEISVNH